jgi:hypothetical protein
MNMKMSVKVEIERNQNKLSNRGVDSEKPWPPFPPYHFLESCKDGDLALERILAEEQVENGVLLVLARLCKDLCRDGREGGESMSVEASVCA